MVEDWDFSGEDFGDCGTGYRPGPIDSRASRPVEPHCASKAARASTDDSDPYHRIRTGKGAVDAGCGRSLNQSFRMLRYKPGLKKAEFKVALADMARS